MPGWDCHGLPIELQVEKKHGKAIPPSQFRELCREYAKEQVERQKKDFIRLGMLGDWDHPYLTMDFQTEADIIRALGKINERGYLYQGRKPVNWCLDCQSALAEAEVEYEDKVSPAIDVGFEVKDKHAVEKAFGVSLAGSAKVYAVIWTTTPWTLPANQGVSVHPELEYDLIKTEKGYLILAFDLATDCLKRYQLGGSNDRGDGIAATCYGAALEGLPLQHPFYDRIVPIICGEHVTLEAGTGLVHTAPAHGVDDYVVGQRYNLPNENPVGDDGKFISTTPAVGGTPLAGVFVWKANDIVLQALEASGHLLHQEKAEAQLSALLAPQDTDHLPFHAAVVHRHGAGRGRSVARSGEQGRGANAILPVMGTRAPRSDDQEPSRLVRVAPAQLGCADAVLRAQGNHGFASAHTGIAGAGRQAGRAIRHRSLVQPEQRGSAGRGCGALPQALRYAGCVVRFRRDALRRAAQA